MPLRVAAVGSGFAGAITAYGLSRIPGVEIVVFERAATSSESIFAAGLNLNPNALSCLESLFPELASDFAEIGYPRKSVTSTSLDGQLLFKHSLVGGSLDLANGYGQRVAWTDANRTLRDHIKKVLRFSSEVLDIQETPEAKRPILLSVKDLKMDRVYSEEFDMVFVADGRFSKIRRRMLGRAPQTWYMGVANFRCLVPVTSENQFDDLELIYNTSPTINNLPESLRSNAIARYAFQAPPRMAAMRTPSNGKDMLYIFGNFAVPLGQSIPDEIKNEEFIRALFTPSDGQLSSKSSWLVDQICSRAKKLHWARFQDTQEHFFTASNRVMFLGDSGKAFSPTLGLGATAAVEQACMAVTEFVRAFAKFRGNPSRMMKNFADQVTSSWRPRVNYIADISARAAMHLNPESGFSFHDEMKAWQTLEPAHINAYKRLWKDYTQHSPFTQLLTEAFTDLPAPPMVLSRL